MTKSIHFDLEKSEFLSTVSGQSTRLIRGALSAQYTSWDEVNEALHAVSPVNGEARVHFGSMVPEEEFIESHSIVGTAKRRINRTKLQSLLSKGATLVLNRFDERFLKLRQLCAEIAWFTNSETLANGYITFAKEGGFGLHWDTHDVMAVQLIGAKRWQVFEPTFENPLQEHKSFEHRAECPAVPILDTVLEAGDVLYVPRGWWHIATPIGASFHVAIGIHGPTMVDYLRWVQEKILTRDPLWRQSLRTGIALHGDISNAASRLQEELSNQENLRQFLLFTHRLMAYNGPAAPFDIATKTGILNERNASLHG